MESLNFLSRGPGTRPAPSKVRRRPAKSATQEVRAKVWVLKLLDRLGATIQQLNCQLVLPPEDFPFELGVRPKPLECARADRTFEGPLRRGADPAGHFFGNAEDRYSLAERCEQHIPGSRSWLMEGLAPYLNDDCPDIGYAGELLRTVLRASGLHAVHPDAIRYLQKCFPLRVQRLALAQLEWLSEARRAEHVEILVALAHESQWRSPDGFEATQCQDAILRVFTALSRQPWIQHPTVGSGVAESLLEAGGHVARQIAKCGHRSRSSNLDDGSHFPRCDRYSNLWPLLCRSSPDVDQLEDATSLQVSWPLQHLFRGPPATRCYVGDLPSPEESRKAAARLLDLAYPATWR